jgi:HEAT repeat protein
MASHTIRETLLSALKDPDPQVRKAAATSLDRLDEEQSVERLIERFESENVRDRVQAVYGLGCLRDKRARKALRSALGDPLVDVRAAATRILGEFPDSRMLEPLIERIEDSETVVRRAAITALGLYGDARVAAFIETALDDPDPAVVRDALEALAQVGGTRLERILSFTEHKSPDIRAAALRVLPEIAPEAS